MPNKTIEEVKTQMNKAYADGTAYKTSLPFDLLRGVAIRKATLSLASRGRMVRDGMLGRPYLDTRTLDVGSGEGGIAGFWPHKNIVGIEISEEAVKKAKAKYPEVDYRCCPVERFELGDEEPFKLVVAQESIEHWTDVPSGLAAIHKAMAPGGSFVLTTPNRDSLHCRMSRKLGLGEPPYCSYDHIHEFGFQELIDTVQAAGFRHQESQGASLAPYWTLERVLGDKIRRLTDNDTDVNVWLNHIAEFAPAEYAFIQCHLFARE